MQSLEFNISTMQPEEFCCYCIFNAFISLSTLFFSFRGIICKRGPRVISLSLMETAVSFKTVEYLLNTSFIVSYVLSLSYEGLLGQPIAKKPKLMRQHDNSYDNIPPSGGSVASPVGSQISNMSNPNKFIKMLGGRDRGRKAKAIKVYMHIAFTFCPFQILTS